MGLFKKYPCPICGTPTGKFLATKVEGQPLCADCGDKVLHLPSNLDTKNMSVDQVREFIAFYEENAALRNAFQESYQYHFGFLGGDISLDIPNRLLRFDRGKDTIVLEGSDIRSFCISEDEAPLFEGTKDALTCCQSEVPDRVRSLGPEIDRYLMDLRQHEQMEEMDRRLREQAEKEGRNYSSNIYFAPDVDRLKPFGTFYLRIELDHPFWSRQEYTLGAPGFSSYNPSITAYLNEYEGKVGELHEVAAQLMAVLNPDAPERQVEAEAASVSRAMPTAPAPAAPVDAVEEIQRYKALLDSGILTEEEFAAKKRQLLGI